MDLPDHLRGVLFLLEQSRKYSDDCRLDAWEFALEAGALRAAGASDNDLRWLVRTGVVAQAAETTAADARRRTFELTAAPGLRADGCFVLTESGRCALRRGVAPEAVAVAAARPTWESERRCLRFGPSLVKQFRVPAQNQELILSAFEEEGWPQRIDDPLPCQRDMNPKRRLHDTINSLNRNQVTSVIRFYGDGRGQAVCWLRTGADKSSG